MERQVEDTDLGTYSRTLYAKPWCQKVRFQQAQRHIVQAAFKLESTRLTGPSQGPQSASGIHSIKRQSITRWMQTATCAHTTWAFSVLLAMATQSRLVATATQGYITSCSVTCVARCSGWQLLLWRKLWPLTPHHLQHHLQQQTSMHTLLRYRLSVVQAAAMPCTCTCFCHTATLYSVLHTA